MQKITIQSQEPEMPENGLAIDESVITPPSNSQFTYSPQKAHDMKKMSPLVIAGLFVVVVIAGIGSGFGIHTLQAQQNPTSSTEDTANIQAAPSGAIKVGDTFGSSSESNFKDSAEGIVQSGGVDGEGSHHLVRPGGKSQTVYLTSSTVDLEEFVGHKVKVWGETFSAQKAGWLMDVGRVKIIELDAPLPQEK